MRKKLVLQFTGGDVIRLVVALSLLKTLDRSLGALLHPALSRYGAELDERRRIRKAEEAMEQNHITKEN